MQRVGSSKTKTLSKVMDLVFMDTADGSWTMIMINPERFGANVTLESLPAEAGGKPRRRFYSTLTEKFTEEKPVPVSNKVDLRPQSITTVYSGPLE
jgi:hypothetical protein